MTAALTEARKEAILASVPLGRVRRADEVAAAVAFLASPRRATSPAPSSRSTAASAWATEDGHGQSKGCSMGILDGKRILVTGVLTDASIAFHVARLAQQEGATVVLTGFGRLSLVERIARRLPDPPPVLELDVTDDRPARLAGASGCREHVDGLDGVVHSIGNAPQSALGGNFLQTAVGGRRRRACTCRRTRSRRWPWRRCR